VELNQDLAAKAVLCALDRRGIGLEDVDLLAFGTTQGDVPVPSFASMVHGRLGGRPMELISVSGVCCSSMTALNAAYRALLVGHRKVAVAGGSELVSRNLKASRFQKRRSGTLEAGDGGYGDYDADFLRFMLSDGAGAVVLETSPRAQGLSLRIEWIDLVSHAHEFDTCMYVGAKKEELRAGRTWLDYPTVSQAECDGLFLLRQDTRLLPDLVRLGVEHWLRLVRSGRVDPDDLDHVLCHYSSEFFRGEVMQELARTGLAPSQDKWFTNLRSKGNTGAASIMILLEDLSAGRFKKGQRVLLMVPESGRFTVAFALLTAVFGEDPESRGDSRSRVNASEASVWPRGHGSLRSRFELEPIDPVKALEASPLGPLADAALDGRDELTLTLVLELALVWAEFERMLRATPVIQRLENGTITVQDYKRLLVNLRQQVMEGARWIARAASNVSIDLFPMRSAFIEHGFDEHKDYQMIERDYCALGGTMEEMTSTPKNVGSEALSSFMFHHASQPDPVDLLGAMFVIEGLGKRKAAEWAFRLRKALRLRDDQVSFLSYHGRNDDVHFDKLRNAIQSAFVDRRAAERIVKTAKVTARLYVLQLEELDHF
jgi:3-oxoacyl-[acyl-carrier-protein] synthase-3